MRERMIEPPEREIRWLDDGIIKITPVDTLPKAERPRIFRSKDYRLVDNLPDLLQSAGFDEQKANGLAVVFHSELKRGEVRLGGGLAYGGSISWDEEGRLVDWPVVVHILKGLNLAKTNHILWHELGHDLFHTEETPYYLDERRLKVATEAAKLLSANSAEPVEVSAHMALWRQDPQERKCEDFAFAHHGQALLIDNQRQ